MGIKYLNKFLLNNCSKDSIKKVPFSYFSGKTIVIDTSIYIYKFVGENSLIENMYLLISIFKKNDITPIFVFDGKPPIEKKELLVHRKNKKQDAETEYNEIKTLIENKLDLNKEDTYEMETKMNNLKKQFIRIKKNDILITKQILEAYGVRYIEAIGEADILCAKLLATNTAWACLSDDMDLFLYGCNRVIRQTSLLNQTCYLYDLDCILKDLDMSIDIFRQIMVVSGTDYNIGDNTDLFETIKWYYEYQKYRIYNKNKNIEPINDTRIFYEWLIKNTKYIENYDNLNKIYDMFLLDNVVDIDPPNKPSNYVCDMKKLYDILREDGFVV